VLDERVESGGCLFLRNTRLFGDFIDDVSLACHTRSPSSDA
jgi:hypothetical protein